LYSLLREMSDQVPDKVFGVLNIDLTKRVMKRSDCSQWICDAAGNVIETHEQAGEFKEP
jgi:hypothetical protein